MLQIFLLFLQVSKSIKSKMDGPFSPNEPCINYIFCHHIGEIPIIYQQHYNSFTSVCVGLHTTIYLFI